MTDGGRAKHIIPVLKRTPVRQILPLLPEQMERTDHRYSRKQRCLLSEKAKGTEKHGQTADHAQRIVP
jgi:hypothetical protein